jgi:lysophospholipase L1-like esterase
MVEANRLVREYSESHSNLGYADLAAPLLDADGNLRDVFVDDGLHLNERGYFLWQQALAPHLD